MLSKKHLCQSLTSLRLSSAKWNYSDKHNWCVTPDRFITHSSKLGHSARNKTMLPNKNKTQETAED